MDAHDGLIDDQAEEVGYRERATALLDEVAQLGREVLQRAGNPPRHFLHRSGQRRRDRYPRCSRQPGRVAGNEVSRLIDSATLDRTGTSTVPRNHLRNSPQGRCGFLSAVDVGRFSLDVMFGADRLHLHRRRTVLVTSAAQFRQSIGRHVCTFAGTRVIPRHLAGTPSAARAGAPATRPPGGLLPCEPTARIRGPRPAQHAIVRLPSG